MDGCCENAPERTMEPTNDDLGHKASSSLADQYAPQHVGVSLDSGNTRRKRVSSSANLARKRPYTCFQTQLHIEKLAYSLGRQSLNTTSETASPSAQSSMPLSSLVLQEGSFSSVVSHSTPIIGTPQGITAQTPEASDWTHDPSNDSRLRPDALVPSPGQSPWCQPDSHEETAPQCSNTQIVNPVMEVDEDAIEVDDKLVEMDEGYFDKAQREIDEALSILSSHRKSGRLPYRSSKEAAMSCPHAIRNFPRMRRRKQKIDKRQHQASSESLRAARQSSMSDAAGPSAGTMALDT